MICHRVLEVIESPAEALLAMATTLRPGGVLSLLVAQRHAIVLSQALAGHIALARRSYADPTRLDYDQVIDAVRHAGFTVLASHGIGAIADHVPERLIEEPGAYDELVAWRPRSVRIRPSGRWPRRCTYSPSRAARADGSATASLAIEHTFDRRRMVVAGGQGGRPPAHRHPRRSTSDRHARRHGCVLRLGRAAPPARAARHAGHRRRLAPRGGAVGQLRGAGPRRTVGHAVRPRPAGWPRRPHSSARTSTATPRCPRPSSRSSSPSPRSWSRPRSTRLPGPDRFDPDARSAGGDRRARPGDGLRRAADHLFGGHRADQVRRQGRLAGGQARRAGRGESRRGGGLPAPDAGGGDVGGRRVDGGEAARGWGCSPWATWRTPPGARCAAPSVRTPVGC